jgi:1,4-dihydroxy-2-naphthoate octaprenyltransferase
LLAGVSPLVLLLSVVVGITTTVILFCSHWHQIQGDIAAGKMSPLVRLGTTNACKVSTRSVLGVLAGRRCACVVCTDRLYVVEGL